MTIFKREYTSTADERTHLLNHDSPAVSNGTNTESNEPRILELPEQKKARWRSIRLMYLTMFLSSVTFTISMASLWPFLQVIDTSATAGFLGWVVAAYSIGQLIASPLFGFWSNFGKTTRWPLIVSILINILANIMYGYLESFPDHKQYFLLLARGLVGFGAGNVAVVRSYVAGVTTNEERTPAMANISIFQSTGFILGPAFQAALVPLGYPGPIHVAGFHLDLYTAPAFISAIAGLINIILLLTIFKESSVDELSSLSIQSHDSDTVEVSPEARTDYFAVISSIIIFFVVLFIFTVFETIGSPLTMDMYGWSKTKATLYQGIILVGAGCEAIVVALFLKPIAKRFSERGLLLFGFCVCLMGYFVFLPWGTELPIRAVATIKPADNITSPVNTDLYHLSTTADFRTDGMDSLFESTTGHTSSGTGVTSDNTASRYTSDLTEYTSDNTGTGYTSDKTGYTSDHTGYTSDNTEYTSNTGTGYTSDHTEYTSYNTGYTSSDSVYTTENMTVSPMYTNSTQNSSSTTTVSPNGCPEYYDWCSYTPVVYLAQFLGGVACIGVGYPIAQIMSYTLYSKILGPKPQGVWMGWLTAAGSLARAIGPVFVTQIYNGYGPRVTFSSCCGILLLTIIFIAVIYKRLIPFAGQTKMISPIRNGKV